MKKPIYYIQYTKYFLLFFLFIIAFLERTLFDLGPNIELVTMSMVLVSYYLGKKPAFWLTFALITLSDRIIGNSNIFIFTWSGFLIPSLLLAKMFKNSKIKIKNSFWKVTGLTGAGLLSNLFFFIYTNFGVWLMDSWKMYSKDLSGLLSCYVMGLPFLKNQIISTIISIPLAFFISEILLKVNEKFTYTKSHQKVFSS